ncbi:AAA family ATPase [Candidatus Pyrohabitans sp.]
MGEEIQYWKVSPGHEALYWEDCRKNGVIGIGWCDLGDLNKFEDYNDLKEYFKEIYRSKIGNNCSQVWNFYKEMKKYDIIIANKGIKEIVGIGIIISDYYFDPDKIPQHHQLNYKICHLRDVNWIYTTDIDKGYKIQKIKRWRSGTVMPLERGKDFEIVEAMIKKQKINLESNAGNKYFHNLLITKKQIILYGSPGTGKTYKARKSATIFISEEANIMEYSEEKFLKLKEEGRIEFVTFHPTYSYEEFVEGYRPTDDGKFKLEDGVFKRICKRAFYDLCKSAGISVKSKNGIEDTWTEYFGKDGGGFGEEHIEKVREAMENNSIKKYVLIIDEINRGNISKIFGELITLLEPDKRIGSKHQTIVTLPYSKEKFGVPPNLYIIGTMNTADRSIALVDIALRRRFGFIEIPPEAERFYEILEKASDGKITEDAARSGLNGLDISELLKAMNKRITFLADREKQIGHAYFLNIFRDESGDYVDDPDLWKQNLHRIWFNEIIPLLQEYFYNDYEKIKKVLGEAGDELITEIDNPFENEGELEDIRRYEIKNVETAEELIEILKQVYV